MDDIDRLAAAGFSQKEIETHMQKSNPAPKFDYTGEQAKIAEKLHDGGFSEQEIAAHFEKKPDKGKVELTSVNGKPVETKGKWKEIGKTAIESVGMLGGAVVGGAAGTLVAPIAGTAGGAVVGAGLGYAGAKSIERLAGLEEAPKTVLGTASQAGKDVLSGSAMELGGQAAPLVIKSAGKVIKPIWGRLTGTGTGSIDEAVASATKPIMDKPVSPGTNNIPALTGQTQRIAKSTWAKLGDNLNPFNNKSMFDKALRGKITGEEIVDNTKSALYSLKNQRADAYQSKLVNITKNQAPIDLKPVAKGLAENMRRFNVKFNPDGSIDTNRIAMGKAGREDIKEMIERVGRWGSEKGDNTASGLDTLKRQLDDFYSDSSQARAFVQSMRDTVNNTITKSVPEYKEMTKGYAESTRLIKDIESGLMLRKQGMSGRIIADQTLRRLTSSMKDNFELRRDLVQILGVKAEQDLSGQIAGYSMRSILPVGLAGTGPAIVGEAALAHFVNPYFWPVLAASSPRASAEFLRMFGKALAQTKGASSLMTKGALLATQQGGNSEPIQ